MGRTYGQRKKMLFVLRFHYPFTPVLEKEMATHSSILAWKIPWMEEPGRLQSMGLQSRTGLSDFTLSLSPLYGVGL